MQPSTAAPDHRTAAAFVDRIVAELEPLYHEHNEAVWRANITGDPAHEGESARLDAEIRKIFARKEPFRFLSDTLKAGGVADAALQRQLVLLHHSFQAHQIPPETIERMVKIEKGLESRFNNFRAELDGARVTDNQLLDVLRLENDSARRRRAWEASKQIGREVRGDLLELVGIRNAAARDFSAGARPIRASSRIREMTSSTRRTWSTVPWTITRPVSAWYLMTARDSAAASPTAVSIAVSTASAFRPAAPAGGLKISRIENTLWWIGSNGGGSFARRLAKWRRTA